MQKSKKNNPMKRALIRLIRGFVIITAWPIVYLLIPPKKLFASKEKFFEAMKNGAVIVANHTEWLDGPLLTLAFLKYDLNFIIAKDVYEKNALIENFSEITRCVPCDRSSLDFVQYANIVKAVKAGSVFVIFPQGHIADDECADMDNFMEGGAMISIISDKPIIPIYKSKSKPFRRTIISVGEPINPSLSGRGLYEDVKTLNKKSMLEVVSLKKSTKGEQK